jgi:hypothetical protein
MTINLQFWLKWVKLNAIPRIDNANCSETFPNFSDPVCLNDPIWFHILLLLYKPAEHVLPIEVLECSMGAFVKYL